MSKSVVFQGEVMPVQEMLFRSQATIIKPPDRENISEEYDKVLDFLARSLKAMSMMQSNSTLETVYAEYSNYKNNLLLNGEGAVDIFLIGPPDDDVAVLLTKYSKVVREDEILKLSMFTSEEVKEVLTRNG